LLVASFIALGAWAFAAPVGAAPDDDFHLTSIWCGGGIRPGLCETGTTSGSRNVDHSLVTSSCFEGKPSQGADCQKDFGIFVTHQKVSTIRGNFNSHTYPTGFYAVLNVLASPDIEFAVITMRLLNTLIFLGSVAALWLLVPRSYRRTLLLMWCITIIPLGISVIPSTNPSSWAITGVPSAWFALFAFLKMQGMTGRRIALGALFVLEAGLAVSSRGDAGLFVVVGILVAVFLTWRSTRSYLVALILPACVAIVCITLSLQVAQSSIAVTGMADRFSAANLLDETRPFWGTLMSNIANIASLWVGAFGSPGWNLGWRDAPIPQTAWVLSVVVAIALSTVAIQKSRGRPLIAWVGSLALTFAIPLYILQFTLSRVGEYVQPRYILPLAIMSTGVLLLAFRNPRVSVSPILAIGFVAALSVSNSLSLLAYMRRYVSGNYAVLGVRLDADVRWWWDLGVSPGTTWFIGSAAFLLAALTIAIGVCGKLEGRHAERRRLNYSFAR
jgi:hypothetical protein